LETTIVTNEVDKIAAEQRRVDPGVTDNCKKENNEL
jgi:hypothetical protein